jgi:CheY-like chemotaxis protein
MRDWGAIFWPEVKGSRYGVVSPAEGTIVGNRAIWVAATTSLAARVILPDHAGSVGAWIAFPVVFLLVSWWGRAYYRGRGPTRPGRVLVVEDDPASLATLERLLRRRGWDVDAATDLETAKEYLARDPSWVLADVRLPDGSGLDLFRLLRRPPLGPRTVVMTAASDPSVLAEISASRPTLVVYKPVDPYSLLDSLGEP